MKLTKLIQITFIVEAVKCKYNKNELCKAEKVHINERNASCETFEMK